MRYALLTALVLFPVLAKAQAVSSNASGSSAAVLEARAAAPAAPGAETPAGSNIAARAVASTPSSVAGHTVVREYIKTRVSDNLLDAAFNEGGTLEYTLYGSVPQQTSAPKLIRTVEVALNDQELAAQPKVTEVAVRATVDQYGYPRNLTVVHSAGKTVDARAMEAIGQYRFKPATVDNNAVQMPVTIEVKLEK